MARESSTSWHTLWSELLDLLITSFERHVSFPVWVSGSESSHQISLEEIRDFVRRHLATISTEFMFGRYTSVHCIIERFFKTHNSVTISDLTCPNGHAIDRQQSPTSSCQIIVFAQSGTSLQYCMDNFTDSTASKC